MGRTSRATWAPESQVSSDLDRRTKIVATIGPASDSPGVIRGLLEAGMDVARLGLAHGPVQESIDRIRILREVAADVDRPLGVLVDLPGPKVRCAPFTASGAMLPPDAIVELAEAAPDDESTAERVAIDLAEAVDLLAPGDRVALGDGGILLVVEEQRGGSVRARVVSGGMVRGRPGVALPESRVLLRSPTERDLELLAEVASGAVDAVAVSFVQSADDIAVHAARRWRRWADDHRDDRDGPSRG